MRHRLFDYFDCRWFIVLGGILLLPLASGCGKVPTWGEISGQQQTTTPTTPVVTQPVPVAQPTTPVAPPKPNAAEVIARFKQLAPGQVNDTALSEIGALTEGLEELTEINASSTAVTDNGLVHLTKLPQLKKLDLNGAKVSDAGMSTLTQIPSLESLSIQTTSVTDSGVAALNALPNLKFLDMRNCQLGVNGFAAIGKMPALEEIRLDSVAGINDSTFDLICNATTLKRLHMNYVGGITDNAMKSLSKLEILEELHVNECPVSCEALATVVKTGLKNLKKLSVNKCPITLAGAKAINSCKSLEHLNVGNMGIDDKGLTILVQGLPKLKVLHINGCKNITGSGFTALKAADDLEILTALETGLVDQALPLLKGHKNLKRLEVGNTKVTDAAIAALKKSLPDCEIIR